MTVKKATVFNKTIFLKNTKQEVLVAAAEDMNESIFTDDPTDINQPKAELLDSLLQDAEAVEPDDDLKKETWEFLESIGCTSALQRRAEMEDGQPDDPVTEKPVEEMVSNSEKSADENRAEKGKSVKPIKQKKAKRFTRIDAAAGAMKEKLDTVDGLIDRSLDLYVGKGGLKNRTQSAFYINCILTAMVAAGAVSVEEGVVTYNF